MTQMLWTFDEENQEWICRLTGSFYDGTGKAVEPATMEFCYGFNNATGYFDWSVRDTDHVYAFGSKPTALEAKTALSELAELDTDAYRFIVDEDTKESILELNV